MPWTLHTPSNNPLSVMRRYVANILNIYSIRQQIERFIEKANLQNKVLKSDFSNNIEEYYAAADVIVVSSIKPHFARPVIEAGAASIPVIASRIGGITEVVEDGQNGFLFTPGNSQELADKVVKCLKDEKEAKRMEDKAFKMAKSRFDSKLHAKKLTDIYTGFFWKGKNSNTNKAD